MAQQDPQGSEATVGVKAMRAALAVVAAAKIDPGTLAARHGFRLADLDDPDRRFAHDVWAALWDDVEQRTGDPGIGIHTAAALPIGHWDVVDYMIASSETLGEGFRKLVRYFPLISTAAAHVIHVGADEVRILREYDRGTRPSRSGTELAVASIVLRFRDLASVPWAPESVSFEHEAAVPAAEYERVFGCPVLFGQPADAIVMRRQVFDIPMRQPEAELSRVLERHARLILAKLPSPTSSIVDRVRHSLASDLSAGPPALSRTAKRMGTSVRTLQRRLDEAGVAYRDLVEQTRERLARRYLDDPTIGLGEIAFLIGFADVSAFYKAFRRWTGQTPGAYRARTRR